MISKHPSLKLPYSIGGLVKLTRFNLSRCIYIEELPDSVGKLKSLVELDLSSTSVGHLPDSIGNLEKLKVLRMSGIRGITKLPSAIGLVEKLEELDARGCCNLTGEIPEEIGRLSRLRILDLSNTRISRLPTTVSHLSNLQTLKLEKCPELKQLPELPPYLTCLSWGPKNCWCSSAEEHRHEPEECWQEQNRAREEYEQEIERRALKEYGIALPLPTRIGAPSQQETTVTTLPTSIGTLSQLKTLKLCCKNVQFLPQLPSSLRELQLRDLATTRSLDFSNLKKLSILKFYGCSLEFSSIFDAETEELCMELCELRKLDAPLQLEMKRLRLLEMAYCEFLPEVLDLSRMKNLRTVSLGFCLSLVEIRGLEESGSLCSLSVDYCPSMERMSDLSKLKKLRELEVKYCRKLKCLQGLNHLESLKKQEIFGNGEFGGDTSSSDCTPP
ncbi:hypothetical protein BT93_B1232 [Corymbia citriodora subsp. variegata]|nr:hypothetical protein BT93_B1232 [Corymbia citriodora subsp. variegata]